uniref:Phosphodiesterase 7B n=1 Tax=Sus scrofa TaxID=9823 RepID=A0A8D0R0V0_PIG
MPVLERYFHSAELGRRWTAPEGALPSSPGSRPGCQQGPLPWDLPEMIRMVKLVWKSKSELQATKQRGFLENEDALHSFPGDVRLRGQTGVPAERRGSYPFIDFRLLNMLSVCTCCLLHHDDLGSSCISTRPLPKLFLVGSLAQPLVHNSLDLKFLWRPKSV